jgi:UDP-GlcNAc:undecaprenyl-phosphate/decaprenyl-phosphate GlcNAc-1-phosphate transferase
MKTLLGFVLAMSLTMLLIPLLMRWAARLGFLDQPDARKVHTTPVPRVGGIAMALAVLLALLLWGVTARTMQALWAGIAILLVFGAWDDRWPLRAAPKFAGQAIAALVMMGWGGLSISSLTLTERVMLPAWVSLPLTFLFLVGCTNAFNLADGLDGLAGGMAMLCLCGTALLAYTVGNNAVGSVAVVMVGALIGFLRFNTHPARVFMGDAGSQMLGFSAAVLALLLTQDQQIPLSTALPLLLLGMPIIDTLMVMSVRLLLGFSPFIADRRHIHHRLLTLGLAHWEAVSILYVLQAALFVAAWYLRYDSDLVVGLFFACFALITLVTIRLAQFAGLQVRSGGAGAKRLDAVEVDQQPSPPAGAVTRVLRSLGKSTLALALGLYAVWVLATGVLASRDIQLLAVLLVGVLCAGLYWRRNRPDAGWTDRLALYSCAALALFISKHGLVADPGPAGGIGGLHPQRFELIVFPVLAVAMVISLRSARDQPFRLTPLDILVLLIVVTVPNLPDSIAGTRTLGLTIAELALLFYSLEALTLTAGPRWRWINGAAAVFLIGLVLRAIVLT